TSSSNEFRSIEWVGADATALPFPDKTFDAALSIAVLHHLPSRDDRRLALAELRRVLQPEGKALVSVWSFDDPQIATRLGGPPKSPDVEIPWSLPAGTTVHRPYHLFREGELERLIIDSRLQGENFFPSRGNCFALARTNGCPCRYPTGLRLRDPAEPRVSAPRGRRPSLAHADRRPAPHPQDPQRRNLRPPSLGREVQGPLAETSYPQGRIEAARLEVFDEHPRR